MKRFVVRAALETIIMSILMAFVMLGLVVASRCLPRIDPDDFVSIDDQQVIATIPASHGLVSQR